jgi:prepilin-type N-terminal cleavage/methylation domain-containing protein
MEKRAIEGGFIFGFGRLYASCVKRSNPVQGCCAGDRLSYYKHKEIRFGTARASEGFSLMELLAVMAIMAILTAITVTAAMGMRPGGARAGAITQVMNSLEEARMTAIEKGVPVYFGVVSTNSADRQMWYHSYILFRPQTEEEQAASGTTNLIQIGTWAQLPQGFYFMTNISDVTTNLSPSAIGMRLPASQASSSPSSLCAVEFGSLGEVKAPSAVGVELYLTEAALDGSGNMVEKSQGAREFGIRIFPYTGRVQLDSNASQGTNGALAKN